MRILIIHNRYVEKGGEDTTVANESGLLIKDGNAVKIAYFDNKGPKLFQTLKFLVYPFNVVSYFKIRFSIRKWNPDIIHVHNFFFSASPLIFWAAKHEKKPVVMTIQNFRLLCPSVTLYHGGHLYLQSLNGKFPWDACFKKVFRHSFFMTFWLAFSHSIHFKLGTFTIPNRIIFASHFSKAVFEKSKFMRYQDRFIVKNNFVQSDEHPIHTIREDYFLFIGRLTEEKGIQTLIESTRAGDFKLVIIGGGEMRDEVRHLEMECPRVNYLGFKSREEVFELLSKAKALIFPSIWYEGMPLTILEAFSVGTPVIASDLGAMTEMIVDNKNGKRFKAGDAADLLAKIKAFQKMSPNELAALIKTTHETALKQYSESANLSELCGIYGSLGSKRTLSVVTST